MAKVSIEGKTTEEIMEMAKEISKGYFRQGLNCSECVFRTFSDMHDINLPEEVITLATGFGGGMGHTKNTCGAITGAVMALGAVKGRRDPFEHEEMKDRIGQLQQEIYPVFGAMVNEVQDHYGSLICKELSDPLGDFAGKARKKNCMEIIAYCSALAAEYAEK